MSRQSAESYTRVSCTHVRAASPGIAWISGCHIAEYGLLTQCPDTIATNRVQWCTWYLMHHNTDGHELRIGCDTLTRPHSPYSTNGCTQRMGTPCRCEWPVIDYRLNGSFHVDSYHVEHASWLTCALIGLLSLDRVS